MLELLRALVTGLLLIGVIVVINIVGFRIATGRTLAVWGGRRPAHLDEATKKWMRDMWKFFLVLFDGGLLVMLGMLLYGLVRHCSCTESPSTRGIPALSQGSADGSPRRPATS